MNQLLFDAAVQIALHDGTDNPVFRRLVAELQAGECLAVLESGEAVRCGSVEEAERFLNEREARCSVSAAGSLPETTDLKRS